MRVVEFSNQDHNMSQDELNVSEAMGDISIASKSSKPQASSSQFEYWLRQVGHQFAKLNDDNKNRLVDKLCSYNWNYIKTPEIIADLVSVSTGKQTQCQPVPSIYGSIIHSFPAVQDMIFCCLSLGHWTILYTTVEPGSYTICLKNSTVC